MYLETLETKTESSEFSLTRRTIEALNRGEFKIVAKDLERMVPFQRIFITANSGDEIRSYEKLLRESIGQDEIDYYYLDVSNPIGQGEKFSLEIMRKMDYGKDVIGTGNAEISEIAQILCDNCFESGRRNGENCYVFNPAPKYSEIMPRAVYYANKGNITFWYLNPHGRIGFDQIFKKIRKDISQLGGNN